MGASLSFAEHVATKAIEQHRIECTSPNSNTFKCGRSIEQKLLTRIKSPASRFNGLLTIRLANQIQKFEDNDVDGSNDAVYYSYLGYEQKLRSHIIHVQFSEGNTYKIVRHDSGEHAFISGYPIASPDGKKFLSTSQAMFAGYNPNAIEIWQLTEAGYQNVFYLEPDPIWGPENGRWLSNKEIRVAKKCHDTTPKNQGGLKPCGVASFKFSNAVWSFIY